MNDIAMKTPVTPRRDIPHTVSPGLWTLAWRRLKTDRVAMVSLAIVAAFLLMMVLSGLNIIAKDWAREVGLNYAPPTFVGPDPVTAPPAVEGKAPEPSAPAEPTPGSAFQSTVVDPIGDILAEIKGGPKAGDQTGPAAAPGAAPGSPAAAPGGFVDPLGDVMKDIEAQKSAPAAQGKSVDPLADVMKDIQSGKGGAAAPRPTNAARRCRSARTSGAAT